MKPKRTQFNNLVLIERANQVKKWGNIKRSLPEYCVILTEETGEIAKDIHDLHFNSEFPNECKGSLENLKKELVQTAAVCLQIYENL